MLLLYYNKNNQILCRLQQHTQVQSILNKYIYINHATTACRNILPGACMAIWFVSLFFTNFSISATLFLTQSINLDILLNASAILFVSWSAVGDDKFDEPKLDSSKAKKRLSTYRRLILYDRILTLDKIILK